MSKQKKTNILEKLFGYVTCPYCGVLLHKDKELNQPYCTGPHAWCKGQPLPDEPTEEEVVYDYYDRQ